MTSETILPDAGLCSPEASQSQHLNCPAFSRALPDLTKIKKQIAQEEQKFRSKNPWSEQKKKAIIAALLKNNGNKSAAARDLGVSRRMVYRYCSELNLVA